MVAIVVDGRYKGLELGSIHVVEKLTATGLMLEGYKREIPSNVCVYVDSDGRRMSTKLAIHQNVIDRKRKV